MKIKLIYALFLISSSVIFTAKTVITIDIFDTKITIINLKKRCNKEQIIQHINKCKVCLERVQVEIEREKNRAFMWHINLCKEIRDTNEINTCCFGFLRNTNA